VATQITTSNHQDAISGSPEKRLEIAPDGTMWAAIVEAGNPGRIRFFASTNGGSTWTTNAGNDLSLGSGQQTAVPCFFIDGDGYAHVSFVRWQADPQTVTYARGVPRSGGGWSWTTLTISPAGGRTGVDSDMVAFRNGTGWVAWVSYDLQGNGGAKVAQVNISSTGSLSVGATQHGPTLGNNTYQYGSLEFAHTGDGKTATATPHVFFTVVRQAGTAPLYGHKATYSGGVWTWGTPVQFTASVEVNQGTLCSCFDGQYLMAAWAATGSSTVNVSEWDPSGTTVTARNPGAVPGGTGEINGISLSIDPSTDDLYLVVYGDTIGNLIQNKFTRATTTWSGWTTAVTRTANDEDGDVQLVRHPPRDSVDMVWSTGNSSATQTIFSQQLVALTRSPSAPTLVSPANGAIQDLASGATFKWTYNPVSPGDSQQAWAFRRVYGGGPTTEYWNASSQTWGGSIVYNTTDPAAPTQATFGSGKWTTGTTYTWSVSTKSATGATSPFATSRTVTAATAPSVAVTAPVGIAYGESTPLVNWTYTSVTGQRDYQVRIVPTFGVTIDPNDPGPAVWDSGVIGSAVARSARVGTPLTNNVSYRAYVRCTDTNAVQSIWAYSDFTVSITPPTGPLVQVMDQIDYTTRVPRIRMDIQARSNYLNTTQANGQTDWDPDSNCSIVAQVDDSANQLLASLKMTSLASGDMRARTAVGAPPPAPVGQPANTRPLSFPVIADTDYTAVASFKTSVIRACRISIRWYDNDDGTGSLISTSVGSQITSSTSAYVDAFVTATAPSGAVLGRMVVEVLATAGAGEIAYVAKMSLHPGRDTAYQAGGYATTQTLRVERSDDGGSTWNTIIDRVKPELYQRVITSDRLMPFETLVQYRAYTDVDPGTGAVLSSAVSPTSVTEVHSDLWAIRDPTDDVGEMNAYVIGFDRSDEESTSVQRPIGRFYPVIDTEGSQAGTGTITLYVTPEQVDTALSVLPRTTTMVIQAPTGKIYYVRMPKRDYSVTDVRARTVAIPFYEVDPEMS
jgi:hypothetical protein